MVQRALVGERHLGAGHDAAVRAPVPLQPTDELGEDQHLAQRNRDVNRLPQLHDLRRRQSLPHLVTTRRLSNERRCCSFLH